MLNLGMADTKWEIFKASIDLFSVEGYANVNIKEIAKGAGIKPSTIYHHFPKGKDEILSYIYRFYDDNYMAGLPKLEEVLSFIGKITPIEILRKTHFYSEIYFEKEVLELMYKIAQIAVMERKHDDRAENLLAKILYAISQKYLNTILNKMVEKDIIEPIDIETFVSLITHYDTTMLFSQYGTQPMPPEKWNKGRELIYKLLCVK